MRQVFAGDHQIAAGLVPAPDYDVGMRMAGVVVVGRDPIEPGPQIGLGAPHQSAGQVLVFRSVLRRHDEAELVAVAIRALEERLAVGTVMLGVVELARHALAGHAVTLNVADMETRRVEPLAGHLDDARLDHDAPGAEGGVAVAAGEHAASTGAAPDAVALETAPLSRAPAARPSTGKGDGAEHPLQVALPTRAGTARADAAEPR
jgi:hypothetical protein